jgi:hypothetical protein
MAVEHELFREVLGADSQRLREAASAEQGRREAGWRRSLCREISLFLLVGADVRADIREE